MLKKIIAFVLCITMVLGLCISAFASTQKTINYVSLGSSQTLGVGLTNTFPEKFYLWEGTEEQIKDWNEHKWAAAAWNPRYYWYMDEMLGINDYGFQQRVTGALPDLIVKKIEKQGYKVHLDQLAMTGMRADDLNYYLYDNYEADFYIKYRHETSYIDEYAGIFGQLTGFDDEQGLPYIQETYRTALENADFITYDLGGNNFGFELFSFLMYSGITVDFNQLVDEKYYPMFESTRTQIQASVNALMMGFGMDQETADFVNYFIDALAYSVIGFYSSYDKSMEWIYTKNPDATVCTLQIQNLLKGLEVSFNGITIPVGEILNIGISMANSYISSGSKYSNRTYYANVSEGQSSTLNWDELRRNYHGIDDLTPFYKETLDYHDENYSLKGTLTPKYISAGGVLHDEKYDETLNQCYDAVLQFVKYIDAHYSIELSSMDTTNAFSGCVFLEYIEDMMDTIIEDVKKGKDNSRAIYEAIIAFDKSSDEEKSYICNYLLLGFGGMDFIHPSAKGYEEMADAVAEAMMFNHRGLISRYINAVDNRKRIQLSVKKTVDTVVTSTVNTVVKNVVSTVANNVYKLFNK